MKLTIDLLKGCLQNQVTIFNNKIINPVNMILKEPYNECSYEQVKELKVKKKNIQFHSKTKLKDISTVQSSDMFVKFVGRRH